MNRRELLVATSASLVGLSIPGWAQVFGPGAAAQATSRRVTILRAALDAARRRGRPLLVLVGDPAKGSDPAQRWTYFLDRGTPRELADLALCDLVCSVREDLVREFPAELGAMPADVMAVLIQADKPGFALIPSSGSVPPSSTVDSEGAYRTLVPHNTAVQRALHAHIAPDSDTLKRRAASARRALSPDELVELEASQGSDAKALETTARLAPALLSLRALDEPKHEQKCVAALGNAALLRWRTGRPPGARWATRGVQCITEDHLEGSSKSDRASGPCGAGYFGPSYSKRFLWFYAEHQRTAFEDAPKR